MSVDMTVENTAKYHSWPAKPGLLPAARSLGRVSVDVKAGLYQLGSRGGSLKKKKKERKKEPGRLGTIQCELVPTCLVKWVPHWNTLYTTKTMFTARSL